eukprot:3375339-Rhodomonas_salina.5
MRSRLINVSTGHRKVVPRTACSTRLVGTGHRIHPEIKYKKTHSRVGSAYRAYETVCSVTAIQSHPPNLVAAQPTSVPDIA